ncbi:LCP family protein [Streptomyces sp. RB6PN25]|uniref:LCP family protein n=1 Tax=Streptomyces humicola TaxID=2953240 RepID=A0ABT1PYV5_9ACTN|nr:LCP family protein [Streptomyces humicola]MCQ4081712.1 LCP family protein [Streptomyces humicola]
MTDISHRPDELASDGPSDGGSDGRRAVARGGRARHIRRIIARLAAIAVCTLVLIVAGAGALLFEQFNSNLEKVPITGNGTEKPDAFGRTPINVLVIGTDSRTTAQDCRLGGDCGSGPGNADVEMIVHVAADRSNATVMSIPRDTVTELPACTDPTTGRTVPARAGMINSALAYGPACQVAAVHQVTGIPVDHFMMADFSGVVNMSNTVGGVPLCVNADVYDTYSHLKLSKGTHTLKGVSALEFLRTRHGFGDGSDLGRTVAQHTYLASLIRTLESAGTLTDPAALYGVVNAASKALTVDNGLGSITKLLGFASDVSKVPSGRITFVTMQTLPDPDNADRVVVAPAAKSLFDAIANDQPLTTGASASPSPSPSGGSHAQAAMRPDAANSTSSASPSTSPSASPSPSVAATAVTAGSSAQTGDQNTCAQVGTEDTVEVNGVSMTPSQAYAASPGVPNSAP